MPTGFTSIIAEGGSFKDYAFTCARAFGALVTKRDEALGPDIPDTIEPSPYHKDQATKVRAKIQKLKRMTPAGIRKAYKAFYDRELHYLQTREKDKIALRKRYEDCLQKAKAFKPPSKEHTLYKDFMIKQIEETIEFDCRPSEPVVQDIKTPREWYDLEMQGLKDSLEYHKREYVQEVARCKDRTKWIRALKKALKDVE
jgi:hypothetical protein